jgi:uncharacterized protein YgiM (DUF1202 family)
MSFRSCFFGALMAAVIPAATLLAQDVIEQPQVENSKYHYEGVINTGSVYVRSGPGEGYYATQKLDKGTSVVVVGIKFDWLKIQPPDGSYSYVGKAFVDLQADGKIGRVNKNDVNVRAGSALNAMKTTVQSRLNTGDQVEVLGQEDEYLKIKPPEGAYVYVNKQFVDATRALPDANVASTPAPASGDSTVASTPATQPDISAFAAKSPSDSTPIAPKLAAVTIDAPAPAVTSTPTVATATTQPTDGSVAAAPSTQPAVAAAPKLSTEELFGKYEDEFTEMSKQPLTDQDVADLAAEYKTIQNGDGLSDNLKRVVDLRIATLNARAESKSKLLDAKRIEKQEAESELARQAELDELKAKRDQTEVEIYSAVGTLQPSSLQYGGTTLYRLTDPATGHTVIYIRTTDDKAAAFMGQFVGVRGNPAVDPQFSLRVITPTDMEAVDQTKVNGTVYSEIVPPSMMARQASASTGSGSN